MPLSANFQSGLELTSAKFRDHPLLLGAGRILNEAVKKTELQIRQIAKPILDNIPHYLQMNGLNSQNI